MSGALSVGVSKFANASVARDARKSWNYLFRYAAPHQYGAKRLIPLVDFEKAGSAAKLLCGGIAWKRPQSGT